ncbi:DUF350 domain-containing protein [Bacillus carboniphilus]|uniref:DUF350 domain-containing protein n=1 Tax=Bacillus carboniphilus TaxID=86663 RepID=A0ABY9JSE2_9BACI|nr:DUF350 domain-containing protein [Bacillus carboniphilus]WLR42325.1 DUF350 domain-containing protein [Bacillus carboniphilus]
MFENILDLQEIIDTLYYFVVLTGVTFLCMWLFEKITPYDDFKQIKDGNSAVAIQFTGKIIGIGYIMNSAVATNDSLLSAAVWGLIGFILMVIGYFAFELFTPKLNVKKEIESGKVSVSIISLAISIVIALITAGAIS